MFFLWVQFASISQNIIFKKRAIVPQALLDRTVWGEKGEEWGKVGYIHILECDNVIKMEGRCQCSSMGEENIKIENVQMFRSTNVFHLNYSNYRDISHKPEKKLNFDGYQSPPPQF